MMYTIWEEGKSFSLIVSGITSLDRVGDLWKIEGFIQGVDE